MNISRFLKRGFRLVELMVIVAILALLGLAAMPAQAQYSPNFYKNVGAGSLPAYVTPLATSNLTFVATNTVTLRQGKGLSYFATINSTNAMNASTNIFKFDVSPDMVRYTTGQPFIWVVTIPQGATNVVAYTNFPALVLDNLRTVACTVFVNGTTNFVQPALTASYSNQ